MDVFISLDLPSLTDLTHAVESVAADEISPFTSPPASDAVPVNMEHDTSDSGYTGYCVVA
uniref:Pheromone n=1 Tax=Lentinula edodes TaxID=5353 RepID=G8CR03_LENED|nr:pheromone precursor [Lentinula edodes]AGC14655.1 pheromone precursor [Lentinula edodes]AGC14666.1 pheromone precursor [Lentinula edodes]AGL07753.1 pheromone precursor [Lentinula edodes]AWT57980.1 Pheromone [Lentinula edodes]